MANCKYCGQEISWLKENGKFTPIDSHGNVHECDEFKKSRKTTKVLNVGDLSPEEIARYESNINNKKRR